MWARDRNPLEVIGRTTSPVIPGHVLQELLDKRQRGTALPAPRLPTPAAAAAQGLAAAGARGNTNRGHGGDRWLQMLNSPG